MNDELGRIAIVALERMAFLDAVKLGQAMRGLAPQQKVDVQDRGHEPDQSGLLAHVDDHGFALVATEGRLPQPEFAEALAPSPYWPEAERVMKRHRAFVVIAATRPAATPAEARAQAVGLTRLAGAMTEILPVLGVYWQDASAAVPPQRVRQALGDLNQNKWPADLWIGYQYRARDADGGLFTGIRSKGALPYLGCELDIPPRHVRDQTEIMNYLYRALADLLTRGRKIRDGEAVRMNDPREAWHQVRYVSHGAVPVVALRELEEPIWSFANVST